MYAQRLHYQKEGGSSWRTNITKRRGRKVIIMMASEVYIAKLTYYIELKLAYYHDKVGNPSFDKFIANLTTARQRAIELTYEDHLEILAYNLSSPEGRSP